MKYVFLGTLLCIIFASISFAHVPGYDVYTQTGTPPTIDGIVNPTTDPTEWADAYHYTFPMGSLNVDVYVKHIEFNGEATLYVGYKIPGKVDKSILDYAKVGIDGWNNNVLPNIDDMLCEVQRGTAFPIEFWGDGVTWGNPSEQYCYAASFNYGADGWDAEFEIYFDNNLLLTKVNGFLNYILDNVAIIDPPLPPGVYNWPPQPNGDLIDLGTWGDLIWPSAIYFDVGAGSNDPGDHNWYYDPEADQYNEMLQLDITAGPDDGIILSSITLQAGGTGHDANDISQILVINDANNNGIYDTGETVLGTGAYPADNGITAIQLNGPTIPAGGTVHLLIVYVMTSSASPGDTYWFTVTSISGTGVNSGVPFTITPNLNSGTKTTITMPTSGGTGSNSPGDHDWYYDPSADMYNEMLQIRIKATNAANIQLNSVTVQASGNGNDAEDINTIYLMLDVNNNGIYDAGDSIVAQAVYAMDNGQAILTLTNPIVIPAGTSIYLLIAYEMTDQSDVGNTYRLQVTTINAVDLGTGLAVDFSAVLPINSAKKTTIEKPSTPLCEGTLALNLDPDTTTAGHSITIGISGLDLDCIGRTVTIHQYSCTGTQVASYGVGANTIFTFNAPQYAGSYIYYACLDINQDQDLADPGEQAFDILTVESDETQCSTSNCGGCTDETACFATGCNWCNNVCQPNACPASGCTGTVSITMPNTATTSESVTATTAGLNECSGRTAYIKQNSCAGAQVASCMLVADTCSISFTAPSTTGNYTYYACIDKTDNADFADAGETASTTITVEGEGTGPGGDMTIFYYIIIAGAIIGAAFIIATSIIVKK